MNASQEFMLWYLQCAAYLAIAVTFVLLAADKGNEIIKKIKRRRKKRVRRAYKAMMKTLDVRHRAGIELAKIVWEEYGKGVEVEKTAMMTSHLDFDKVVGNDIWDTTTYETAQKSLILYVVSSSLHEPLGKFVAFVERNRDYLTADMVTRIHDKSSDNWITLTESSDEVLELGFDIDTIKRYVLSIPA